MGRKTASKYQSITRDICQLIQQDQLQPGMLIPSYTDLSTKYQVTPATVRKAVMVLQAEGIVEAVPGVGCVVLDRSTEWAKIGVVLTASSPGGTAVDSWARELETLHAQFAELYCDVAVKLTPSLSADNRDALAQWSRRQQGVLICGNFPVEMIRVLVDSQVPVVVEGEPLDGECPEGAGLVTVDLSSAANLAVSHLVALGHRRIALFNGARSRYYDLLSQSFKTAIAENALDGQGLELRSDTIRSETAAQVVEWLEEQAEPPSAIIVDAENVGAAVIDCLEASDWAVPQRISVLAISSRVSPDLKPNMTRVVTPIRQCLTQAVEMLERKVRGKPTAMEKKIVARFVPGTTTGKGPCLHI